MITLAPFLLLVALALAFADERRGALVLLGVGIGADVVRKVTPGQPVLLSALVAVVAVVMFGGLSFRRGFPNLNPIYAWRPYLRTPTRLFMIWVSLMSLVSVLRGRSLLAVAMGAAFYVGPFITLAIGIRVARSLDDARAWVATYAGLAVLAASGVFLSALGVSSPLLEQVGTGFVAYAPGLGILELRAGFFRTSEIAGWHIAMAIQAVVLLVLVAKRRRVVLPLLLIGGLCVALLWTGRRKYLVQLPAFGVMLLMIQLVFGRQVAGRFRWLPAVAAVLVVGGVVLAQGGLSIGDADAYLYRLGRVDTDSTGRFVGMLGEGLFQIVESQGLLGGGVGIAVQGSQSVGVGGGGVGHAAEGGIGTILAEIGVPGLLLVIWIAIAGLRHLLSLLRSYAAVNPKRFQLTAWTCAVVVANAAVFSLAKQVYGDPFVRLLLGALVGLCIGSSTWASTRTAHGPVASPKRRVVIQRRPLPEGA